MNVHVRVLDRHQDIIRSNFTACRGREVHVEGDGFLFAFDDARAAVQACRSAQRALHTEPWPSDGLVRVRMGIHCGSGSRPVVVHDVALAVHQAARVVAAGHGGQVIASAPVVTAAADLSDVSFVRLGRFRLRGSDEPQPLFQLTAPGLPDTFAAPRAVPSDGHNIVRPASSFLGRERDLVEVASALSPRRLVTLLGPGGVGKSRLAAEVAVRWRTSGTAACGSSRSMRSVSLRSCPVRSPALWACHSPASTHGTTSSSGSGPSGP